MKHEQLLLFEEPLEGKLLREIQELKQSIERIRKGQYAKMGELKKCYDSLKSDVEIIKIGLCKAEVSQKQPCEIFELALL